MGEDCAVEKTELWNFDQVKDVFLPVRMARSNISVLHFTGNWGCLLPKGWGNLTGIGLPDVPLRHAFPRKAQLCGCLLHFALGSREPLRKAIDHVLGGDPRQIALQLRTGDSAQGSALGFMVGTGNTGADLRPVISDRLWGLGSPNRAATVMATCFRQLCQHLFLRPLSPLSLRGPLRPGRERCLGFFETDNFDARHTVQELPENGAAVLKTSSFGPHHSMDESATTITLASLLAMASHDVLLVTFGGMADTATQIGPAIRPGARSFSFERFLEARAWRNQSDDTDLCNPSFQPEQPEDMEKE